MAVFVLTIVVVALPGTAFGSTDDNSAASKLAASGSAASALATAAPTAGAAGQARTDAVSCLNAVAAIGIDHSISEQCANKVLPYDRALIEEIGTQESTGHRTCCPSFSCAYGDAVIDGTVNDHCWYTCWMCAWPNWSASDYAFESADSEQELLREAYDQILAGMPTVIYVQGNTGEHWICLIGYENVSDPDDLTLDNFIALDPWDGEQLNAGERFVLHPGLHQHLSSRDVQQTGQKLA